MIKNQYEELKGIVEAMEKDVVKFEDGNNTAGTRIRKLSQEGKGILQELRKKVQEIKNQRTAK